MNDLHQLLVCHIGGLVVGVSGSHGVGGESSIIVFAGGMAIYLSSLMVMHKKVREAYDD